MLSRDYGNLSRNRYTYSMDINDENKNKYKNNIRNDFLGNLNNKYLFNTENNSRVNINKSVHSARIPLSNYHCPISIWKPDFQNIQINFENDKNENSYHNRNISDLKTMTPQYNSHISSISNSLQEQSFSNFNSNNSINDKNCESRNRNSNTFNCLSDLTKEKLKQIELSKKINDYNLIENDLYYKRNHKYLNSFKSKPLNTNYKVFYNEKSFENENNEKIIDNEKNEKGKINKQLKKAKIKRYIIPKKQNDNYFNSIKEPLNSIRKIPNKENDEFEKEKNKDKKEEKNMNVFTNENENQQFKNENQFNKQSLNIEKPTNDHFSEYSQRKNLNKNLESEFNKFLKDENEKLKKINYAYKQLIDTFFYFINNLSHKFSYYKELFELKYYLNHLDDLSKNLIALEHCILSQLSQSTNLNEENVEKIRNINEKEIINNYKLSIPLELINEISFQIPDPIQYQKKINELHNIVNKLNQPLFSFKTNKNIFKEKIKEEIKEEDKEDIFEQDISENKEDNYNESINTFNSINNISNLNNKKDHDCFACTIGCSVSKRGYSTMAYNPYIQKSYSSRSKSPSYRKENLNIFQKNNKKSNYRNIDSKN